ncbi:hypothetical protein K8R43_01150 [archaeon]|nr:hypothetical protein [archaeon]
MAELRKLKEERDNLNEEARTLIKQGKETTVRVKRLRAELREFKTSRDEENAKVREFKEKRDAVNAKIRTRINKINKIQEEIRGLKGELDMPFHEARKQLERLEWKVQTEVMNVRQEEKIVRKIEELEEATKSTKEFMGKRKDLEKIKKELDELRKEAQAFHEVMLEHTRKSEYYHQKMLELYKNLKALEPDFKDISDKITKAKKKADKAHKHYIDNYKETKGKTEKDVKESMKKKADKLMEGFKKGKKLTTDELQIIQHFG